MTERWRTKLSSLDRLEPRGDLWARAVSSSKSIPPEPSPASRQRLVAAILAAMVAVGGSVALFVTFRGTTTPSKQNRSVGTGAPPIVTYRDPNGVWEISWPDPFQEGAIPQPAGFPRVSTEGIWISNFGGPPFGENSASPNPSALPDDGVAVEVTQTFGGPGYIPQSRDSSFPLSMDEFRAVPGSYSGTWKVADVVANGEPYEVTVRTGPDASAGDRQAATDIVSSFRIVPLQQGTTTGRHVMFDVLGSADSYPVGSVTRLDTSELPANGGSMPFYLVHVPEGFYALAWPDDRSGGYKNCDVTYDPGAREFSCPNGARWGLDGSVIAKPAPTYRDDPLEVLLVRISLDGHVLVSPNVFMGVTSVDLRMTGP